jgi:hypothetical protein
LVGTTGAQLLERMGRDGLSRQRPIPEVASTAQRVTWLALPEMAATFWVGAYSDASHGFWSAPEFVYSAHAK